MTPLLLRIVKRRIAEPAVGAFSIQFFRFSISVFFMNRLSKRPTLGQQELVTNSGDARKRTRPAEGASACTTAPRGVENMENLHAATRLATRKASSNATQEIPVIDLEKMDIVLDRKEGMLIV